MQPCRHGFQVVISIGFNGKVPGPGPLLNLVKGSRNSLRDSDFGGLSFHYSSNTQSGRNSVEVFMTFWFSLCSWFYYHLSQGKVNIFIKERKIGFRKKERHFTAGAPKLNAHQNHLGSLFLKQLLLWYNLAIIKCTPVKIWFYNF